MNPDQGTVLIVDDERSIRLSLRTILSSIGFTIVEAARGEEALALVRTAQFDAILLDINMPGMGGVEVCRIMRKNSATLPIVMLTVQGNEDRKVDAFEAGADDYILSPFIWASSLRGYEPPCGGAGPRIRELQQSWSAMSIWIPIGIWFKRRDAKSI